MQGTLTRTRTHRTLVACAGTLLLALAGCAGSERPLWGGSATLRPPRARVGRAAIAALKDPNTWVPAAGAIVFGLTDWDDDVADWARRETPVFGSNDTAGDTSDVLLASTGSLMFVTGLATPSGTPRSVWARNKARGFAVEGGAVGASGAVAWLLKQGVDRTRPDGSDEESFPSAHTTLASSFAALARRNTESMQVGRRSRFALDATATTLAAFTGWARIEAGAHHPSDVLAGYALGNATSVFLHDTFLGRASRWRCELGWRKQSQAVTLSVGTDL